MPSAAELAAIYATPHNHRRWKDHVIRVDVTASLGMHWLPAGGVVADLSCGDGEIVRRIAAINSGRAVLGDFAPGYPITGPIEATLADFAEHVDLWVCCETIEHLDDPAKVLAAIRPKASMLLLSTPAGDVGPTNLANPEHVWSFETADVDSMLRDAGWLPLISTVIDFRPANVEAAYQIWVAE
jgi:hypothetical protein